MNSSRAGTAVNTTAKSLGRVLIVDDDADVLTAARLLLKPHARRIDTEPSPAGLRNLLRAERYDLVLLDMNFSGSGGGERQGLELIDEILAVDPAPQIVVITAHGDIELAVDAMKRGAADFVLKPWRNEGLLETLRRAVAHKGHARAAQERDDFALVGSRSPAMREVLQTLKKVAGTDANVLLLGENGTGKEVAARFLHGASLRAEKVFQAVDLGALSDNLFESELFGHVKGAFTDAREDRPGRFELASGGTLFLDEIGNVPVALQAKLLTVLQNRRVTRVGSSQARPVDIRLVCATNKALYEMVAERTFREDLLYRINTVEVHIPPLRARGEDIPELAHYFLTMYAERYDRPARGITEAGLRKLTQHSWPGNVRELMHAVERAVVLGEDKMLRPTDFFLVPREEQPHNFVVDSLNLADVEKQVIRKAIDKNSGNISHAARELGLTRTSLYRRLEKYGL